MNLLPGPKSYSKEAKTCSKIYSLNAQGAKDYLVGRSNANNIDLNR